MDVTVNKGFTVFLREINRTSAYKRNTVELWLTEPRLSSGLTEGI